MSTVQHSSRIILGSLTAVFLLVSLLISCVRNCWHQIQAERRVRSHARRLSTGTRPDSVFIQQLEEEMLHCFHQDVLVSLQPLAHGHESSISVRGFNGVCLESTYSKKETEDFLRSIIKGSLNRRRYLTLLENQNK